MKELYRYQFIANGRTFSIALNADVETLIQAYSNEALTQEQVERSVALTNECSIFFNASFALVKE